MLAEVIKELRKRGKSGVAIIDQGGSCGYVALAVDAVEGVICDPRSWESHPTPLAAVANLAKQLGMVVPVSPPNFPSTCPHEWHKFGTVNGKPDIACQLCGVTKQD